MTDSTATEPAADRRPGAPRTPKPVGPRPEPVITWPNHLQRIGEQLTLHWQVNHADESSSLPLELRVKVRGRREWEQVYALTGTSGTVDLAFPELEIYLLELGIPHGDVLKPRHRVEFWRVPDGITEWTSTAERLTGMREGAGPRLTRILDTVESTIDLDELDRMERRYSTTTLQWRKYFDLPVGIDRQLRQMKLFKVLQGNQPRRVLDIGSGPGHFLLVSRILGHDALGIDLPDPIFDDLNQLFGNSRITEPVLPQKPFVPQGQRFDLIYAVDAAFHDPPRDVRVARGDETLLWTREDWKWFIGYVREVLTDSGLAVLKMNYKESRTGLRPGTQRYTTFMRRQGVSVNDRIIKIRRAPMHD